MCHRRFTARKIVMSFQVGDVPVIVRSTVIVDSSVRVDVLMVPSVMVPAVMLMAEDKTLVPPILRSTVNVGDVPPDALAVAPTYKSLWGQGSLNLITDVVLAVYCPEIKIGIMVYPGLPADGLAVAASAPAGGRAAMIAKRTAIDKNLIFNTCFIFDSLRVDG